MNAQDIYELRMLAEKTVEARDEEFSWSGKDVASEVMQHRVDGATVQQHIRDAMHAVVKAMQEANGRVEKARKAVEAPGYSGTPIDLNALEKMVLAEVREVWGEDDPGAKLFAAMLAKGKFIY